VADPRERVFLATPFQSPSTRIIASPFQFTTDENTFLRVATANSLTGVVLAIQGRRLTTAGAIEPIARVHTPNTDRSVRTEDFQIGSGALLNLVVFASSGAPLIGQTYAMAHLLQGSGATAIVLGTLFAGYVTSVQPLAYPGSPVMNSLDVEVPAREVSGTQPAGASEVVETVPTGARWELITVSVSFVASGGAGNRHVAFGVSRPATATWAFSLPPGAQPPGTTYTHIVAPNLPHQVDTVAARIQASLPQRLIMTAGNQFVTLTTNLQAGDQFGTPRLLMREWLEAAV